MAGRWLASIAFMYVVSRALPLRLTKASASASAAAFAFVPNPLGRLAHVDQGGGARRRRRSCHHPGSDEHLGRQHQSHPYVTSSSVTQRASSSYDEQGRRIRNRSNDDNGGGDDDEPWRADSNKNNREKDRWDDVSDGEESRTSWKSFRTNPRGSYKANDDRDTGRGRERSFRSDGGRPRDSWRPNSEYGTRGGGRDRMPGRRPRASDPDARGGEQRKINMNALEGGGLRSPANRRDLSDPDELAGKFDAVRGDDDNDDDDYDIDDLGGGASRRPVDSRKPEAQFRPWLFVQEKGRSGRSSDKALQEQAILKLAAERNVPVATVDKGVLNALSGNRPHQGVCLRCGRLDFTTISRLPVPDEFSGNRPRLWLVLDEVVDPQNFGALLRSLYFLGGIEDVRILVCGKNSAPPSPIVSAASAGALEIMSVYSTNNLPRTLAAAEEDGFAILGASSQVRDLDTPVYDLQDLPLDFVDKQPTVLVLGSEGSGLRHLVAKSCTHFVRIPSGQQASGDDISNAIAGVDSLNVSVTGGILLWRLLTGSAGR